MFLVEILVTLIVWKVLVLLARSFGFG
jgi:hypothetical protein